MIAIFSDSHHPSTRSTLNKRFLKRYNLLILSILHGRNSTVSADTFIIFSF